MTVTDEAGNAASATITLTKEDRSAPTLSVKIPEKNVIAGVTVTIKDNQLFFNGELAASWTDDFTTVCKAELSLTTTDGTKAIASGDKLSEAGTLKITVSDEFQNAATAEIALIAVAVYGLENLSQLQIKVDEHVDLLQGLTFAEGITLQKVEIVQDDVRTVIDNPNAYTAEYPGGIGIVLTFAKPDGGTLEVSVNDLTIKPLDHSALEIVDINPVDILPVI